MTVERVPLYPQGGIWIFDRANWCPGDKININKHDVTNFINPGEINTFSFSLNFADGSNMKMLLMHIITILFN